MNMVRSNESVMGADGATMCKLHSKMTTESASVKDESGGGVADKEESSQSTGEMVQTSPTTCKCMTSPRFVHQPVRHFIDNSGRAYFPINLACGVQAMCRPDVLLRCRAVLNDIHTDIMHCLQILPPSVHRLIKRTRIWVNCSYSFGPESRPVVLSHSTAHHHEDWLLWYVILVMSAMMLSLLC
jgi:hypothetical protein